MQVEQLFSVAQRKTADVETAKARQVLVLDLKRATTIGIRMSRLKYALAPAAMSAEKGAACERQRERAFLRKMDKLRCWMFGREG